MDTPIYKNKSYSDEVRARDLIKHMSVKEKVGQLAQNLCGFDCYNIVNGKIELTNDFKDYVLRFGGLGLLLSFFRADPWSRHNYSNGITLEKRQEAYMVLQKFMVEETRLGIPVLLEENAAHGLQVLDSVLYPTSIGMGSSFDKDMYYDVTYNIAQECKDMGVLAPNISVFDIACDPRWGRNEECISEDPYLASKMAYSAVRGAKDGGTLICCKHFCGQGAVRGGRNISNANIGERELREIHLPAVKSAVSAGADLIMAAYNGVDGTPCHANSYLLKNVLRNEFDFDGIIRSDRTAIDEVSNKLANNDYERGAAIALKSGVECGLGDYAFTTIESVLEKGYVKMEDVDTAVYHVLVKKFSCGLMDNPYYLANQFDRSKAKKVSKKAASESLVLLKNDDILPINKENTKSIAVIGYNAGDIYSLLGDYTAQQKPDSIKTIAQAIGDEFDNVTYTKGWDFHNNSDDFENAITNAENSDVVIFCMGGSSVRDFNAKYAKSGAVLESKDAFMDCGEGRDVSTIHLPGNQVELLKLIKQTGKKIVCVLVQGRPYALNEVAEIADAIIVAWYPGMEGASAISDAIFGKTNCFGRMSVSVAYSEGSLPANYNHHTSTDYINPKNNIVYPFGSGMNYSEISYKNLIVDKNLSAEDILSGKHISVSITAKNESNIPVNEVVMLYIHALSGSIERRRLELKGFERIELLPGESKEITFALGKEELSVWNNSKIYTVEPSGIELFVGGNINRLEKTIFNIE